MKKLLAIATLFVLLFASEGNAQNQVMTIGADGVGPIKIGATLKNLPPKVEGLYDKIVPENSDMVLYSFYLNGSPVIMTNGNDKIEFISVESSDCNAATEDNVRIGMTAAQFKKKTGWKRTEADCYEKAGVHVYIQRYDNSPDEEVSNISVGVDPNSDM